MNNRDREMMDADTKADELFDRLARRIGLGTPMQHLAPLLTLVTPDNAASCIGKWFRIVTLSGSIHGRIVGVDADNHTLRVADCQLSKIDIDDIMVWAENDDGCN